MQVMMIGYSGSGKTTYMAGMYNVMNGIGICGFSVKAVKSSYHKSLQDLGNGIREGRYPSATDIHQEYDFHLKFNGSHVLPFSWYDYRGGALLERSSSRNDVADLSQKIGDADALIVFLDSDEMVSKDPQIKNRCRRTAILIQKAVSGLPDGHLFPISFVITKGDRHEEEDLLGSYGMKQMEPIISLVGASKSLHGLITITEIKENICNTQFPFLFSMAFAILSRRDQAAEQVNDLVESANRNAERANFFDDVACGIGQLFGGTEESWSEIAERQMSDAKDNYEHYEQLGSHLENVIEILKESDGKELFLF